MASPGNAAWQRVPSVGEQRDAVAEQSGGAPSADLAQPAVLLSQQLHRGRGVIGQFEIVGVALMGVGPHHPHHRAHPYRAAQDSQRI